MKRPHPPHLCARFRTWQGQFLRDPAGVIADPNDQSFPRYFCRWDPPSHEKTILPAASPDLTISAGAARCK